MITAWVIFSPNFDSASALSLAKINEETSSGEKDFFSPFTSESFRFLVCPLFRPPFVTFPFDLFPAPVFPFPPPFRAAVSPSCFLFLLLLPPTVVPSCRFLFFVFLFPLLDELSLDELLLLSLELSLELEESLSELSLSLELSSLELSLEDDEERLVGFVISFSVPFSCAVRAFSFSFTFVFPAVVRAALAPTFS